MSCSNSECTRTSSHIDPQLEYGGSVLYCTVCKRAHYVVVVLAPPMGRRDDDECTEIVCCCQSLLFRFQLSRSALCSVLRCRLYLGDN